MVLPRLVLRARRRRPPSRDELLWLFLMASQVLAFACGPVLVAEVGLVMVPAVVVGSALAGVNFTVFFYEWRRERDRRR